MVGAAEREQAVAALARRTDLDRREGQLARRERSPSISGYVPRKPCPSSSRNPSSVGPSCSSARRRITFFIVSVATTFELSPSV
jgi:hypothetical protein